MPRKAILRKDIHLRELMLIESGKIISVQELFDNLEGEYSLAVSEFLNKKVVPDKIAV